MKAHKSRMWVLLSLLVLVSVSAARAQEPVVSRGAAAVARDAAVPQLVKFAGTVKDSLGQPRTGTVGITFSIYREQEGGPTLWMETQNVSLDAEGQYSVLLGAETRDGIPLDLFTSSEPRWLGVHVQLPAEVEQPRVLLVSVPYALKAGDAETLGGRPASDYVLTSSLTSETASTTGTETTKSNLIQPSGVIGPLVVDGVGTPGRISKFLTSTTIGDSLLSDNGTRINVGGGVDFTRDFSFVDNANPLPTGRVQLFDRPFDGFVIRGLNIIFETLQSASMATEAMRIKPDGNIRFTGMNRSGSETGTSELPTNGFTTAGGYVGLIVRRVQSRNATAGQVVARTNELTLERDGTNGGWRIVSAAGGTREAACMGVDSSGVNVNFVGTIAASATAAIYSDGQNVVSFQCSFGDAFLTEHVTQVILFRRAGDFFWVGSVTSTWNQ